jgi:aspartate-semialdehyde dehydrogenase
VVVTAYRAVSDFGQSGIDELSQQVRALFNQEEFDKTLFPHQIAFSCLPYHSGILDSGHDLEEQRIMEETRSILDLPELRLSLTSVIAPIFCGNSLAVHIETTQKLEIDKVREIFNNAPSLLLEDVPAQHAYPVSFATIGKDEVSVGRIRPDPACENGLILWSAVDNIRKGNALNMIQIAETLLQHQR